MDDTENPPAEPAAPRTSLPGRMLNVFAAPGEVFEEVKSSPPATANWLAPALIFILVGWVCAAVIMSQDSIRRQLGDITSQAIEKQIAKGKIPKEQADAMRQVGEKWGSIGTTISLAVMPVLGGFIAPFWGGLLLWLFGRFLIKVEFGFMKAVEIAGLGNMIGVLDAIVKTLLIVGMGNLFASPSLALLVKDFNPQNTAHGVLAVVNVMSFWFLGVRTVGLAKLSGASAAKAAACIFGLWAVITAGLIGFGAAVRTISGG